jgi:regulator of cell morphogenesis and NO signaling
MEDTKQATVRNVENETVGDVVAQDYRAADVFEKYGIDFCCGGNISLAEACRQRGVNPQELERDIAAALSEPREAGQDFDKWELPDLAAHIEKTHHAYLKENISSLQAYAEKIAQVHGANHPEVIEISVLFQKMAAELMAHLREEEEVLFPAIRKAVSMKKEGAASAQELEAMRNTLKTLTHEHDAVGAAVHEIRHLAKDYTVPADACNTFMVTYRKLKEFEDDLHKHVHLENNILFPKAAKL